MSKIGNNENMRTVTSSELAGVKCTSAKRALPRVLVVMFVISLIIAASLLLVAFLTPGISSPVYLALLITIGCVTTVGFGASISALFLKCVLGKEKKEILDPRDVASISSRRTSSCLIFEFDISPEDWKKFDQESRHDIKELLKATCNLKNEQGAKFAFDHLYLNFLNEIRQIQEVNWETNKVTMQLAGQALSQAIFGSSNSVQDEKSPTLPGTDNKGLSLADAGPLRSN
ncbi:hypothetical protein [Candidatus Clavichlamydia salmonicola]|uniref:hypothetical protein n=1 Tax=Candidatus Clavichlamydia salmonicola TaxID=469812 RepID=UPI00189188E1|nr:hypothetical protein [Candidatus Clavichlamydia salmonicola]